MKLEAHREILREVIAPYDNTEARDVYRSGDFPRSEHVVDLNKRYRWDLFWMVRGHDVLRDAGVDLSTVKDAHIDTLLRSIVAPL